MGHGQGVSHESGNKVNASGKWKLARLMPCSAEFVSRSQLETLPAFMR